MKSFNILTLMAAVAIMTACLEKEEDFLSIQPKQPEARKDITITAIHDPATRTGVQDGGTSVLWSVGDKLRVFNGREDAEFLSQNTEPVRIADFHGELEYFPGDTLFAVYPWRKDASFDGESLSVTLPYYQQGVAGSFADDMNLSVATSTTMNMAFYNVCGGVRFTVSRDDICRVALQGIGAEALAGKLKIQFEGGRPCVKSIEDEANRVVLVPSDRETFEPGKWYYIVMAPVTLSLGVQVYFYTLDDKTGIAESENPLTITRSVFVGKENLDAQVKEWKGENDSQLTVQQGAMVVEIPSDANENYAAKLKFSNFYGDYPIFENTGGGTNAPRKRIGVRKAPSGTTYNQFSVPFGYVWGNYMFHYITDQSDNVVMCCLAKPGDETVISAESTAIGLLFTSHYLITDDPDEIEYIIGEFHDNMPEFDAYVAAIQNEIDTALRQPREPDFTRINKNPVILALMRRYAQTPDAIGGLDLLDISRNLDDQIISLKIRNHFRRVIHIYAFREYMTTHRTGLAKEEPIGMTLQEIIREMSNSSAKELVNDKDYDYAGIADDLMEDLLGIEPDIYPFPYILEPESANFWKLLPGAFPWWRDTTSPFENTTDLLDFDLKGADNLRLDIYGLGKLRNLSTYSPDEYARMLPVIIHGVVNDFVMPVIDLITGAKALKDTQGQDHFKYDLRYGARKAPFGALVAKLEANWTDSSERAAMWNALADGDFSKGLSYPFRYVAHEVFGNRNPDGKTTYWNLLYNCFKSWSGISAVPENVREGLKSIWNQSSHVVNTTVSTVLGELGFAGAVIKLSEAGINLYGSLSAAARSDFITTFREPLDDNTHIAVMSPRKSELVHGSNLDLSWHMYYGKLHADVCFDLSIEYSDGFSVQKKVIKNIMESEYSLDLTKLGPNGTPDKLTFKIIAHDVDASAQEYAASDLRTVYLADFMKDNGAVDLRLSVQWASCNLGASSPMATGGFYGWGETGVSKQTFSWATYQHSTSGTSNMKKYNVADGLMSLLPEDDAVHKLMGGQWRIPTIQEWQDLKSQCIWEEVLENEKRVGYCITSPKNGNHIFLPCSGQKSGNVVHFEGYAKYWASNRDGTIDAPFTPSKARALNEDKYGPNLRSWGADRCLGMPLRGVLGSGDSQTSSSELVDLGLSVKWAACNIGASNPNDPGEYFAWGEITSKSEYTWANYDYRRNSNTDMKKYNGTDNLQVVDAEEDIVHVRYGGNWRMPTLAELDELRNNCTWEEIKEDGVLVSYKIISKVNYNYIILPAAGYKDGSSLKDEHKAHYWTGTRNDNSYSYKARALNNPEHYYQHYGNDRYLGMPVRGVRDDSATSITRTEYVDLGLSVKWASCNIGAASPEYSGDRYAWGSTTSTLGPFTWGQYCFSKNGSANMSTYNGTDNLQYLRREDDIVYLTHNDARWRMPSINEWQELKDNCTWKSSTLNGRRGYLISSKVNGNSIFLPIAGYVDNEQLKDGMRARYWSSTRNDNSYTYKARALNDPEHYYQHYGDDRRLGMTVRGVYDSSLSRDMLTAGELVDLGLSVKWASHNIGASVPEESGKYYAWGELAEKSSYTWANYGFSANGGAAMSKYNATDNVQYLKRESDISYRSHTGNGDAYWRTPTIDEWKELKEKCTWVFKILNGRRGYLITGPNGNSIFLPVAGLKDGTQLKEGMSPRYWSSSRNDNSYDYKARALNDPEHYYQHFGNDRYLGMPIRAIFDDSFQKKKLSSGELVDMGLSVKWASHNIGASLPEETGNYYAWGELAPKSNYTWANYKFSSNGTSTMTKYNGTDDLQLLEREDDMVYQKYKGKWRIPTKAHWDELLNNCDKEIVRKNGRRGYLFTSRINGNSIFLPIAGVIDNAQPKEGMSLRYWSSTRNDNSYPYKARALNDPEHYYQHFGNDRYLGMPVRAIFEDYAEDLTPGELIDMGLSVKWASTNMGAASPEEAGNYYAWGELEPKSTYSWSTYKYSSNGGANMSRYNGTDDIQYMDWNDDVVHKTKGGDWRMPTINEWKELQQKCTWVEQVRNGRKGYKITSTVNGNSIFLPIAGLIDGAQRKDGMRARYWSSSRNDNSYTYKARALFDPEHYYQHYGNDRYLGMPVRGVFDDSATKMLTAGTFIDMGLSVNWASSNYGASQPEYAGSYYAWGELDGKITYTWATYRFSANNGTQMSKYNGQDNLQQLDINDDIIQRRSGGANRMPTIGEWNELKNNCDWIFKIKNGRPGYVLVSKKNKNAIFLPLLGYIDNEQIKGSMTAHYWSSTRNDNSYPYKARALNDPEHYYQHFGNDRYLGMPLRGVRD